MSKVYSTRSSFVLDALNRSSSGNGRNILDAGFIGEYNEAAVHYNIVDSLKSSDCLIGIDLDRKKMESFLKDPKTISRKQKHNLRYEIMPVSKTGFSEKEIDVVLMLEVFEHLSSPYSVFEEIKRILKPGGNIIMTYPNPLSWKKMLKFIFQRNLLNENYLKTFKGAADHKIFPHPACLVNYLNEMGFKTQQVEFIKYNFRFSFLNNLLLKGNLTRKFASYIGIHSVNSL